MNILHYLTSPAFLRAIHEVTPTHKGPWFAVA
jgi:hypothetical protein